MNEAVMKERLLELADAVSTSAVAGTAATEGTYLPQAPAGQASLDEALDHLRLQLTYVMFDLEATKRENRYLRQMLEGRSRPEGGNG